MTKIHPSEIQNTPNQQSASLIKPLFFGGLFAASIAGAYFGFARPEVF